MVISLLKFKAYVYLYLLSAQFSGVRQCCPRMEWLLFSMIHIFPKHTPGCRLSRCTLCRTPPERWNKLSHICKASTLYTESRVLLYTRWSTNSSPATRYILSTGFWVGSAPGLYINEIIWRVISWPPSNEALFSSSFVPVHDWT